MIADIAHDKGGVRGRRDLHVAPIEAIGIRHAMTRSIGQFDFRRQGIAVRIKDAIHQRVGVGLAIDPDRDEIAGLAQSLDDRGPNPRMFRRLIDLDVGLDGKARIAGGLGRVDDREGRVIGAARGVGFDIADDNAAIAQRLDHEVIGVVPVGPVDSGVADAEFVGRWRAIGVEHPALQPHRRGVV